MERRAIEIQGTVQGVGFRPFVHALATRLQLGGFVKNHGGSVLIEVEGEAEPLDRFLEEIVHGPPPLARIEDLRWLRRPPRGDRQFQIEPSEQDAGGPIVIAPDVATCDACLAELLDPRDRRYRYPFINCTHCGPRLSIVTGAPYDRLRTTMASFPMCPACRQEYESPADRRFHAQPIACPRCGPRLSLTDARGTPVMTDDPLASFIAEIRAGKIGAMKGLGGYHLVCDARSAAAVAELRRRKQREEKPFAVMVADVAAAETLCEIDAAEMELLTSIRRPIVLLRKRGDNGLAAEIAPGNPRIGVMLPYTPLHHLLLRDMANVPLVMTSGNRSDEPIVFTEPEVFERLAGIADVFLVHNRPIHVRCDDSVTRVIDGSSSSPWGEVGRGAESREAFEEEPPIRPPPKGRGKEDRGHESPVRRSRGYAPQPIALPMACPVPILAVGAQLKAIFALGSERRAILSQHMGDLDHLEAFGAFARDVDLYERLYSLRPAVVAHDMHPDYASTRYAMERRDVRRIAVQHHHAHMASCMAEHGLCEPVIGVIFDGAGYGTDGTVWGGEFLIGDYRGFSRAAHFRNVGMPGGEQAVREPWRMAAAHLRDANALCKSYESRVPAASLQTIRVMLDQRFNTPSTSSVGRLFDAVASLCGLSDAVSYEGQAAMQLESHAAAPESDITYPIDLVTEMSGGSVISVDTRPMIRAIAADVDNGIRVSPISRAFHRAIAEAIVRVCVRLRAAAGLDAVVLSGGVFMNALLTSEARERLEANEFRVHCHRTVPPNDGGISLGQLIIAAAVSH